ncbi:hypothetical protein AB1Y20_015360 [Prymnesium parvum]|uniref:Methyltransferase domain-containing protein n=1 Tax=Prymnesium parvum TaxID=97485 RepID=A0AB34JD65_PRYPA
MALSAAAHSELQWINDSLRWATARGHARRAIRRPAGQEAPFILHALPRLERWHVTSQDRLFHHLRQAWPTLAPRTMVDVGCHSGHGPHANLSDALLWLDLFNESGGVVVGIDAHEEFALDLQRRFDLVPPYSMMDVTKRAYTLAITNADGGAINFPSARMHISCCAEIWCNHSQLVYSRSDHLCRMTQMRLGLLPAEPWLARYPSSLPPTTFRLLAANATVWNTARPHPRIPVPRMRLDTFWKQHLQERTIDVLKVDIDQSWREIGLEGLLQRRGFRVFVMEVDGSWGGVNSMWNVSQVDQLVWLSREHGYDSYLKIPCEAQKGMGSVERGSWQWDWRRRKYFKSSVGTHSAYLFALGSQAEIRVTNFHSKKYEDIQDIMLLDSTDASLTSLPARMRSDCKASYALEHIIPA